MENKEIIFLCGVNGTGKSTIIPKFEKIGYSTVDVDKSNFKTDSQEMVRNFYENFKKKVNEDLPNNKKPEFFKNFYDFFKEYIELYTGICNRDASSTLLVMFEKISGVETSGVNREIAIDVLYKEVLAPVYKQDTIRHMEEAEKDSVVKMCIDVGSRKFFFIDDKFLEIWKVKGFKVSVVYMDLDLEKNVDNLFNEKNGKYVLFDRLNLIGVLINCLENEKFNFEQHRLDKKNLDFKNLTKIIKNDSKIRDSIRKDVSGYMSVRKQTLATHFQQLQKTSDQDIKSVPILYSDTPEAVFKKISEVLVISQDAKFITCGQSAPTSSSLLAEKVCCDVATTAVVDKSITESPTAVTATNFSRNFLEKQPINLQGVTLF